MAIDQDTIDHYDPIISALKARISALETAAALVGKDGPDRYEMFFSDGTMQIYDRREPN